MWGGGEARQGERLFQIEREREWFCKSIVACLVNEVGVIVSRPGYLLPRSSTSLLTWSVKIADPSGLRQLVYPTCIKLW
jgi:hypothetical protein